MRLELWIIGNSMGEDLETPQDFKKKKVSFTKSGPHQESQTST